mgnify:FL=1
MKIKLSKIKKDIEKLEEMENLILDARKTIKWNKEKVNGLKDELLYKKSSNLDYTQVQYDIYQLQAESASNREFIKDLKREKESLENALKLIIQ